jgi:hypothetical protein
MGFSFDLEYVKGVQPTALHAQIYLITMVLAED